MLSWGEDDRGQIWGSTVVQAITASLIHESAVFGTSFSLDGSRVLSWNRPSIITIRQPRLTRAAHVAVTGIFHQYSVIQEE